METLAFILSAIGTVCSCIPPLLKGKNMNLILLLLFLANATVGVSYILTDALNGGVSCLIGAAQSIVNYFFEKKEKALPKWLIAVYALAFTAANLLVFHSFTDILAILACLCFIGGVCQKSGKKYRLWFLFNTGFWLAYDIINASYGPLALHAVLIFTTLFGMIVHDCRAKAAK